MEKQELESYVKAGKIAKKSKNPLTTMARNPKKKKAMNKLIISLIAGLVVVIIVFSVAFILNTDEESKWQEEESIVLDLKSRYQENISYCNNYYDLHGLVGRADINIPPEEEAKYVCLFSLAKEKEDYEICYLLPPKSSNVTSWNRDYCLSISVKLVSDTGHCGIIEDDVERERCWYILAKKLEDKEICKEVNAPTRLGAFGLVKDYENFCKDDYALDIIHNLIAGNNETWPEANASMIRKTMDVPLTARYAKFDFKFANKGDKDYLVLYFGDDLIYRFVGTEFEGKEMISSGLLPIRDYAGENITVIFALIPVGKEEKAEIGVGNLEFVGVNYTEITECNVTNEYIKKHFIGLAERGIDYKIEYCEDFESLESMMKWKRDGDALFSSGKANLKALGNNSAYLFRDINLSHVEDKYLFYIYDYKFLEERGTLAFYFNNELLSWDYGIFNKSWFDESDGLLNSLGDKEGEITFVLWGSNETDFSSEVLIDSLIIYSSKKSSEDYESAVETMIKIHS